MLVRFKIPGLLFLILCSIQARGQHDKLRFKKPQQLCFFQAGEARDTISVNRGDLFYLLVPDTLRPFLRLETSNARLEPTGNDSLLHLVFIPGHNYELFYVEDEQSPAILEKNNPAQKKYILRSGINGAAPQPGRQVTVRLRDRRSGIVVLENYFIYGRGE